LPNSDDISFNGYHYNIDGEDVGIFELKEMYKTDMFNDVIDGEKHSKNLKDLYKASGYPENGDTHIYERLLTNALVEQLKIAKKFGLPAKSIYKSMKLDFRDEQSRVLMDNVGFVYPFILQKHIDVLKKSKATDEQIITEISGHIFHESLHDIDGELTDVLFGGKRSFGEVTSITGQLAYYLEKGYDGPKGYDVKCSARGQKKIKEDKEKSFDHETATVVASELLLEQLKIAYPDIEIDAEMSLDACEQLVAQIPPERRDALIPALKEAILQSADEKKFNAVVARLKEENLNN